MTCDRPEKLHRDERVARDGDQSCSNYIKQVARAWLSAKNSVGGIGQLALWTRRLSLVVIARTSFAQRRTMFGCVICNAGPSCGHLRFQENLIFNSVCDLEETRLKMKLAFALFISELEFKEIFLSESENIFVVSFSCHINHERACRWRA